MEQNVIYCIKQKKGKYIIKIFERLREINILSNIRLKNKKKNELNTLRFFYLINLDIKAVNGDYELSAIENMVIKNVHVTENKNPLDRRKSGERH